MERGLYNKIGGKKMNKKGFSLVEIMLVMAIIGLLVSLLLPFISKARWNAQMKKCGSKLKSLYNLLEDFSSKSSIPYTAYTSLPKFGLSEGDPLPTGSNLWRVIQYDHEESQSDVIKNNPTELKKQVYELYVCNIKGEPSGPGKVSYRGPNFVLTPASVEGGAFIGGDDLLDHGREKNRQINVLLGDGSVRPQVHDDPQFQTTYNQTTLKN